jgi:hypothetical protein
MNKICGKCGKHFVCNNGCARLGLSHGKVQYGGCYCSDCARKFEKSEVGEYPKDLKEVCSRFCKAKETVSFT